MAKHIVTGQAQPATGVFVTRENTPGVKDMPSYPGIGAPPPPTRNERRLPSGHTVRNLPSGARVPNIAAPVPPSSQYVPPPEHVTGSEGGANQPPRG